MRILVAGWFSFEHMGTTAGDLMCKDVLCQWLDDANVSYDVAILQQYANDNALDWQSVDPQQYTDLVFVCGPFGNGKPVDEMLLRFSHCRLTGINISLLQQLSDWNPFSLLYERDHGLQGHPDLVFFHEAEKVPVTGVILAHKQKEYGNRALHHKANEAIFNLLSRTGAAAVNIDTCLPNAYGLNDAAQVESLISKMDIVVTTRLHGLVLSLKNGVPVIPIDPIAGGAKIRAQVEAIGWPILFDGETVCENQLLEAFAFCRSDEARKAAAVCAAKAHNSISKRREKFIADFQKLQQTVLQTIV